jgi:dTDP-4-amino-4,6-dideoxygalactose transaminase
MPVPFFDIEAENRPLLGAIEQAVRSVFEAQNFILGPAVERFERNIAAWLGVPHAVGVSSGTDALLISLLAAGIGAGDEVVTTPFTFFATAGAILRVGARPVFVDIEPDGFQLDAAQVERVLSPRTRALLPVHLFGGAAPLGPLVELAKAHQLTLIEDTAQALGTVVEDDFATNAEGPSLRPGERLAGTVGDYGCFSFFPSKNLGGAGDGGLVVCARADRAEHLRRLRAHGAPEPHRHEEVGGNFRLDALQAAVLDVKLPHLSGWLAGRRRNAERYRQLFSERGLVSAGAPSRAHPLVLPSARRGHSYNQFVVRAFDRDGLVRHLRSVGVGCAVYYPRPLHLQPALACLGYGAGAFPEAERAAAEVLALPVFPALSAAQAEEVAGAVASYYRRS